MEHVLRYYSYRDWFAFKFGINTALRCGDMLRLKVHQVRYDTHLSLKEAKTRKLRRFFINATLRPIIDDYIRYMEDDDYLFRHMVRNDPVSPGAFYRTIRQAGERIGLHRVGTHTCRKTFAYHFYREVGDIALLMELLNHSNERETLLYIGVIQDELDQAVGGFSL
ncbi:MULTISPECIES: tyrosine-type recombinase/integrase [unclassified Paenibacillus]|uniref:tyrosine-type recombinase/integrase n=1 Tax=unclassified Paenibacillus TaxID=185978 RepID=UPI000970BC8C|nr:MULTISPECIES: tyrosine-type recombinase/integrase [unclassified Paenibacillus]